MAIPGGMEEAGMIEHPIPFTGPMIRAIQERRKTQTRRIIRVTKAGKDFRSPYGVKGDHLWVRETWQAWSCMSPEYDEWDLAEELGADIEHHTNRIEYKATSDSTGPWRPPMFMPRWASRITLVNEGERIERVQEITEEDAIAEGIRKNDHGQWLPAYPSASGYVDPRKAFWSLWDSINAKRGYGWDKNPRVRVVTFRLVEGEA